MDRKNVAIFFGGCSPEYGVSLQSASAVLRHLDRERYCPVPVGITAGGDWFYYSGDVDRIEQDTWRLDEANCVPAAVSPSRSQQGLLVFQDGRRNASAWMRRSRCSTGRMGRMAPCRACWSWLASPW